MDIGGAMIQPLRQSAGFAPSGHAQSRPHRRGAVEQKVPWACTMCGCAFLQERPSRLGRPSSIFSTDGAGKLLLKGRAGNKLKYTQKVLSETSKIITRGNRGRCAGFKASSILLDSEHAPTDRFSGSPSGWMSSNLDGKAGRTCLGSKCARSVQTGPRGQGLSRNRTDGAKTSRIRVGCSLQILTGWPLAMVGELVAAGTTTASTTTAASGHILALATVTQVVSRGPHLVVRVVEALWAFGLSRKLCLIQVAVTAAAFVYGAYFSPYASKAVVPGRTKQDSSSALIFGGVDVTRYKIFQDPEVQRAIAYATEAHAGQMRKTGEPYISHCIHTARILAGLVPSNGKQSIDTVIAGVLHDVIDDTGRDYRDIRNNFGEDVAKLVQGVSKLSYINQLLRRHRRINAPQQSPEDDCGLSPADVDSLRVMLLGMVNDPRVVLIKLADRLHNMRTIYALPSSKACAVAQETLAVWCSLASRLGVWAVKAELEDLCFAVLQPQTFRQLRAELASIWSPHKDWRHLRRITKRAKRRALLYGDLIEQELEKKRDPEDEEELTMQELLEAVVPFDILLDRSKRSCGLGSKPKDGGKKTKVVRDAEVALAALGACEEILDRELLISTSYIPGMEVTLSGRLKSLYSTHCKMRRKGVGLDQVYDARALRVVVGDAGGKLNVAAVEGCYNLLSVVHSLWTPVGGEFDDYIVNPKPSGYQSLHTAVRGPDGAPLEVQIRTQGMHEYAEYGHAAHWLYKEGDAAGAVVPGTSPVNVDLTQENAITEGVAALDEGPTAYQSRNFENVVANEKSVLKQVRLGHPALRVEEGRLLAAVIVRVDDGGRELLVAVSFALHAREAVAAGRSGNQRKRWETYARLYKKVSDQWWFAPGHGDWSTCLEKYKLCRDGIYHKQDQFDRSLSTFIQLLDLNSQEQEEYVEVMSIVEEGKEVDLSSTLSEHCHNRGLRSGTSTAARLNNKVRLLRSMLQWEQELRHEASTDGSVAVLTSTNADSAVLTEVLVIRWPDGEIMRMPAGSTASDAARRMGFDGYLVYLNGQIALPNMKLRDGDLMEVRS